MRTVHARRRPPAPMRVFLQQHSSRGAGAEKHWLWLTPLAPEVCKKPGKPYCLPFFCTPFLQNCRAKAAHRPASGSFGRRAGKPSAVTLCCRQGNMKRLCAKIAFRGQWPSAPAAPLAGAPVFCAGVRGAARSARAKGAMHAPGAPAEQCQNGKYLKAAQQHVCREHQL